MVNKQLTVEVKDYQEYIKSTEASFAKAMKEKKQVEKALSKTNMMLQTQQVH